MRMLSRPWAFFWVLSATFNGAFGKGFEFELSRQNPVSQKDYESLTSGLSKTFGYSWMSPASPTGLVGFDVGIGAAFMKTPSQALSVGQEALGPHIELPKWIGFPKITLQKGLPASVDLGANIGFLPGTQWKLLGAGLQWAFLDGTSPLPSVAIRVGHSALIGDKALASRQTSVEAVASIKLPPVVNIIEPYGVIGFHNRQISSEVPALNTSYSFSQKEWQVGLGARLTLLPFVGIVGEVQWAEEPLFQGRLSVRL